jgi:predicted nucleotidyltransferase
MVRRLISEFAPDKILLFGSRAIGIADENSDYDILVVVERLNVPSYELAERAHRILSGLGVAKDIFFTSREKFQLQKSIVNTLSEIAATDGKELYAA